MIPKYLQIAIDRFKEQKKGMQANPEQWVNMPVTIADIDNAIATLEQKADEMGTLNSKLQQLQQTTRAAIQKLSVLNGQAEKLAKGIHALEQQKFHDYGIKLPKSSKKSLPVPGQAIISQIVDDSDGEGFIVHIQFLPSAYDYEIWRAVANPETQMLEPSAFSYVTSTKRLVFTDNDVVPGKRYFYRVRGYNRKGHGEWSNMANKVQ